MGGAWWWWCAWEGIPSHSLPLFVFIPCPLSIDPSPPHCPSHCGGDVCSPLGPSFWWWYVHSYINFHFGNFITFYCPFDLPSWPHPLPIDTLPPPTFDDIVDPLYTSLTYICPSACCCCPPLLFPQAPLWWWRLRAGLGGGGRMGWGDLHLVSAPPHCVPHWPSLVFVWWWWWVGRWKAFHCAPQPTFILMTTRTGMVEGPLSPAWLTPHTHSPHTLLYCIPHIWLGSQIIPIYLIALIIPSSPYLLFLHVVPHIPRSFLCRSPVAPCAPSHLHLLTILHSGGWWWIPPLHHFILFFCDPILCLHLHLPLHLSRHQLNRSDRSDER